MGDRSQWWNNWLLSYGYVASEIASPRSLEELTKVVRDARVPIRAVGGGWSSSDAALPFRESEVRGASLARDGATTRNRADPAKPGAILENFGNDAALPLDSTPLAFQRAAAKATVWDALATAWVVDRKNFKALHPQPTQDYVDATGESTFEKLWRTEHPVQLIDIRQLRSSLQVGLDALLDDEVRKELSRTNNLAGC